VKVEEVDKGRRENEERRERKESLLIEVENMKQV